MYSGTTYTHGINVNYLNSSDKAWLARTLYLLKRGHQILDGVAMYRFFKLKRYNIIKTAYRVYFTALLNVKPVCSGLAIIKHVYPSTNPWIAQLNEMLKAEEVSVNLTEGRPQIAYDPAELQTRVMQAVNSVPIQAKSVAPYAQKATWLRK